MALFFITDASRFRIPGTLTLAKRVGQVRTVNGCRIVHTGCSPETHPRVVPLASSVHVLNQRSSVRSERRGLTPVGTALAGEGIGSPSWMRGVPPIPPPLMQSDTTRRALPAHRLPLPQGRF